LGFSPEIRDKIARKIAMAMTLRKKEKLKRFEDQSKRAGY